MRVYSAENQEALQARRLLKEWSAEGLLSQEQYSQLEQETVTPLRPTNIFLRGVLFFFTLLVVAAGTGLFFVVFLQRASASATGIVLLMFALLCYAGAEMAVAQADFYRHGIEEALAVCSVGFLYAGLEIIQGPHALRSHPAESLIPALCAIVSVWIWHRFGYWYMFVAGMIFTVLVPDNWTTSHAAQRSMVAAIYLGALAVVATVRSRRSALRFDYLRGVYSGAEALLWGGVYLSVNLKVSVLTLSLLWWSAGAVPPATGDWGPFYWCTWVLTWCLPPLVLARGIREKDRFVLAAGLLTALLTLATNKPYLGWPRHTWDPMVLGLFLIGAVLWLQRWLARGPGGVREGFTAARLSSKDKSWMDVGSGALGLLVPQSITPSAPGNQPELPSRGGASGGAGASRDY